MAEESQPEENIQVPQLGFLQKPEKPYLLHSSFFPSKVGGKPSWLDRENLPHPQNMRCKNCDRPLAFLLQFYASLPFDETFHRTLFVFCCKNGPCHAKPEESWKALRSQLPQKNKFYEEQDPQSDDEEEFYKSNQNKINKPLCVLCGQRGDFRCSACKMVNYCSKQHQSDDWIQNHKKECSNRSPISPRSYWLLFPEFEIVTEPEPEGDPSKSQNNLLEIYKNSVKKLSRGLKQVQINEDEEIEDTDVDKAFLKFQSIVSKEPEQVLRYYGWENAEPLWYQSEHKPKPQDIPKCLYCGSERILELQILPQMLNYIDVGFDVESIDWGTILVYTCKNSCDMEGLGYMEEFIWRQAPLR